MKLTRVIPSVFIFSLFASSISFSEPKTNAPDARPDPELLGKLGQRAEVTEGYSIRPPKGYRKVTPPNPPTGATLAAWVGARRDDGTAPMIQIIIVRPPAGEEAKDPEEFLSKMIKGVQRRRKDWNQTKAESVKINGLIFLRTKWEGTSPQLGMMHGVMYTAVEGRSHISIHCQDVEPHHKKALSIGEAAARTFKRK